MKLYKIKYAFIVAVGLMLHSCLDLEPKDQLAETNIWSTPSDFELFANQFYGWSRNFSVVDNHSTKPLHSDYNSDLMTYKDDRNRFSNGSNAVQESDGNYGDAYAHIRRTNLLLKNAEDYSNQADIAQFVGEAKFFRAYSYFDLLQLYGNAILVKEPMEVTDARMYVKQNDRSEVADFIIKDLKEAVPLLPKFSEIQEYGRISREGCQAFLSRVALYEGTWQKSRGNVERGKELLDIAAKAAKDVIDSKTFSLFKPEALGDSAQKYMFILEDAKSNPADLKKSDNKEYIFVRSHEEVLSPIGTNITKGCLNNTLWISRKFANMYLCSNGLPMEYNGKTNDLFEGYTKKKSEFQNRDNRMKYTLLEPGVCYFSNAAGKSRVNWDDSDYQYPAGKPEQKKYEVYDPKIGTCYNNQKWCTERFVADTKEGYDYPIIRYAEVLLNYAEAVYERDNKIDNTDLDISLNLVRCRVNKDMPKLSNELVSTNGLSMQTEIRRERTVELFNEGFRIDDLKRWKIAETEMPQDILGIKKTGTDYAKENLSYSTDLNGCIIVETGRKWEEKNYLYPLPADQLQLNPNLGQNFGWE